jgi:hypothetical protein
VLAAILLVVVFSLGLAWVLTTVGLVMRSPDAALTAVFAPLTVRLSR